MKNRIWATGITAVFFMMLLGSSVIMPGSSGNGEAIAGGPVVSVAPVPVKPRKGKIAIAGSGFKPGQRIGIRVFMGGVLSDISYLVKPKVEKTNKFGAFGATWGLRGREFKRGLLKAGTTLTVSVVDEDGNTLATAPLMIDKAASKKKKKK